MSEQEGLSELLRTRADRDRSGGASARLERAAYYPVVHQPGQLTVPGASGRPHNLKYETARLVLVIDQLEELFTNERFGAGERRGFVALLQGLLRSGLVWIVATMRKDYLAPRG